MSYTTDQLAEHVLRKLRVIDATETISDVDADQVTLITDTYRAKWDELSSHGNEKTYWAYDTIPNPVFLILRDLVALEVMEAFGFPISPAEKDQQETIIMRKLHRHTQVQKSTAPTKAVFY